MMSPLVQRSFLRRRPDDGPIDPVLAAVVIATALGLTGSYFSTDTNFDATGIPFFPATLQNLSRMRADLTGSIGLSSRLTLYGRLVWQREALETVTAARKLIPGPPHVACFDTAFHVGLPEVAIRYPVPAEWRTRWGVRSAWRRGVGGPSLSSMRPVPAVEPSRGPSGGADSAPGCEAISRPPGPAGSCA